MGTLRTSFEVSIPADEDGEHSFEVSGEVAITADLEPEVKSVDSIALKPNYTPKHGNNQAVALEPWAEEALREEIGYAVERWLCANPEWMAEARAAWIEHERDEAIDRARFDADLDRKYEK